MFAVIIQVMQVAFFVLIVWWVAYTLLTRKNQKEQSPLDPSETYPEKLFDRNYEVIENYYGRDLPPILKQFYNNDEAIQNCSLEIKDPNSEKLLIWYIEMYFPMNQKALDLARTLKDWLPFAEDGEGNYYVFDPRKTDLVVFLYQMENNELIPTDMTLESFLIY